MTLLGEAHHPEGGGGGGDPLAGAPPSSAFDGYAHGAMALLRDAHDVLEAFAARACAPGAGRVHDDGPVTTFMRDCRAAKALRERLAEAIGPHPQAVRAKPAGPPP